MWVFLDNTLVCDIGGVHSSVGEYVNLWDYLEKGRAGKHTLSFFYTERGASGSTCYMSFTLPSVSGINIEQKTGDLTVKKEVVGESDPTKEFRFEIHFTDKDGKEILDDYSYTKTDRSGSTTDDLILHEGSEFTLKDGETLVVDEILPDCSVLPALLKQLPAKRCRVRTVGGSAPFAMCKWLSDAHMPDVYLAFDFG